MRLPIILSLALLCAPPVPAQPADSAALLRQQSMLLSRRADVSRNIEQAKQRLLVLDRDRQDRLEELEQLYVADRAVRTGFSPEIKKEIALRASELRAVETERSDCLEVLDSLFAGLTRLNDDIGGVDKALR